MFWATVTLAVGGWNVSKHNGHDPAVVVETQYKKWLMDQRQLPPTPVVDREWPDTFEHHVKRTTD